MAENNYPILMDSEILGIDDQETNILKSGRLEAKLLETVLVEKKKRVNPFSAQLVSLEEKRNELLANLDLDGDIEGSAEALASVTIEINEVQAKQATTPEIDLEPLREIIKDSFENTNGGIALPKQVEDGSNLDLSGASQTEENLISSSEFARNLVGPIIATSNLYEAAKAESENQIRTIEAQIEDTINLSNQIEAQLADTTWSAGLTKEDITAKYAELLANKKGSKATISKLNETALQYTKVYDNLVAVLDIKIASLRAVIVDFLVQNPQVLTENPFYDESYPEEIQNNDQVIEPTDVIGGMFSRLTKNIPEEAAYTDELPGGNYEDPGTEEQYEIEAVNWKEIFGEDKYPELMTDRNFAQKYCNAIALVAKAGIEVFDMTLRDKSSLKDPRVDYKNAIDILDGLTINDFLSVFAQTKDISAMRILSLVYKIKIDEFVEPENFAELLSMIRNNELDIDADSPTLGDAVESYYLNLLLQEYESDEETEQVEGQFTNPPEDEDVPGDQNKEQKLEKMAKRIIKMARERISEQSAAENMTANWPMSGATMDKLLGGVARVRHIAEQKRYIERPDEKGGYDELSTIIIAYGKTDAKKFQDSKRSWKLIETIKAVYENENQN